MRIVPFAMIDRRARSASPATSPTIASACRARRALASGASFAMLVDARRAMRTGSSVTVSAWTAASLKAVRVQRVARMDARSARRATTKMKVDAFHVVQRFRVVYSADLVTSAPSVHRSICSSTKVSASVEKRGRISTQMSSLAHASVKRASS